MPIHVPTNIMLVIEQQIDAYGLVAIIDALGEIASEKAEHIRTNTAANDPDADKWDAAAGLLAMCSSKIEHEVKL